ncbi:hypothetical protein GF374_00565 [Candidatus Woesearchaeota archaeon]|nr:hypothetical protein [Candidatus Woesearchaeota archaeon]
MRKKVTVNDKMQKGYVYYLTEPIGKNFNKDFKPDLTPKEMLELGVFGGRYIRDCKKEFPKSWYQKAKLYPEEKPGHDSNLNYFKTDASQPLSVWRKKGWINEMHDPRGWFQWYCRYYMGRRVDYEDKKQIKRWKAFKRHIAQVKKNCRKKDFNCRPKQRQSLLHWAYDSRKY